jgi:hypothetical protein
VPSLSGFYVRFTWFWLTGLCQMNSAPDGSTAELPVSNHISSSAEASLWFAFFQTGLGRREILGRYWAGEVGLWDSYLSMRQIMG